MAKRREARIGFISPAGAASSHLEGFRALVPEGVRMDLEGLGLKRSSFDDFKGTTATAIRRIQELVGQRGWEGVMVGGAPFELMNPGLVGGLNDALEVPVTTALGSCIAALKAFSAQRVLLMTPFDDSMNQLIRAFLRECSIDAVSPAPAFLNYKDAMEATPDQVYTLTRKGLEGATDIEGIYFQGGVFDPLKVMEKIEKDTGIPVVASNLAMLWFIVSKIGLTCRVRGYGRLLEEWLPLH